MLDKIRKQMIGDKEYSFKMTNKTIRKIDEKYGNYASIIYGLMQGQQFFTNSLKLISMSCIDREFDIEELEEMLTGEQYQELTNLASDIYFDYMGIKDKKENKENEKEEEKN